MKELEQRINSVELCGLINQLRIEENGEKAKVLKHCDLMKKIKKEINIMERLGLTNQGNISLVDYKDNKGQMRPCFSLNASGMRQILNSESTYVRYKTEEYISRLEQENQQLKTQLSPQEQLALQLFNGGLDAITAHQKLLELETKPLLEKIEEDKPKVQIADERLLKNGCYTITEINRSLGLKRGRLTKWAKEHGYIHKTITEVNEAGRAYFKIYDNGGYKAIGITEEGLSKIQENLENIK